MPKNARKDDVVKSVGSTCRGGPCPGCPHPWTGTIMTGMQTINNQLAARVTDTGPIECPHGGTFMIVEGSGTVTINGQKAARIGDLVRCVKCGGEGKIIKGSHNTETGG